MARVAGDLNAGTEPVVSGPGLFRALGQASLNDAIEPPRGRLVARLSVRALPRLPYERDGCLPL